MVAYRGLNRRPEGDLYGFALVKDLLPSRRTERATFRATLPMLPYLLPSKRTQEATFRATMTTSPFRGLNEATFFQKRAVGIERGCSDFRKPAASGNLTDLNML